MKTNIIRGYEISITDEELLARLEVDGEPRIVMLSRFDGITHIEVHYEEEKQEDS